MRLKNDTENFAASFNITPPYQMLRMNRRSASATASIMWWMEVLQKLIHDTLCEEAKNYS